MNTRILRLAAIVCLLQVLHSDAATLYVDLNSPGPVSPYSAWATAAATIQDAVDAASPGDVVLVTNGLYATGGAYYATSSNRVGITKPITVQSVNGPGATFIQGHQDLVNGGNSTRGVYLTNGAVLSGFTITNGNPNSGLFNGAGIYCGSTNELIVNCVLVSNTTMLDGGGVYGGTLSNCVLLDNSGRNGGAADGSVLINCTLNSNAASLGGGAYDSILINCLVISNFGGNGGGAYDSTLLNCTVISNRASVAGGAYFSSSINDVGPGAVNTILYSNTAASGNPSNYFIQSGNAMVNYCLTTPAPSAPPLSVGNLTNAPVFVDPAHGDYHLVTGSPGMNRGNNAQVALATDKDGNPRIVGSAVDMGAYEIQTAVNVRYVDAHGTNPVIGYISWATAATNLQDAADLAAPGDTILVADGDYLYGGKPGVRLSVSNSLTIESVNGPATTIIDGNFNVGCVGLWSNVTLIGFTLTNGYVPNPPGGAGAYCLSTNDLLVNCVIGGNSTTEYGGGGFGGTYSNCTIINNHAGFDGGGVFGRALSNGLPLPMAAAMLENCQLIGNSSGQGTAAYGFTNTGTDCVLNNCTLTANAGPVSAYQTILNNCSILNSSGEGAGWSRLANCTVSGNAGGIEYSTATHCTVSGNGGGALNSTLTNCLLIGNSGNGNGTAAAFSVLNNCLVASNSFTGNAGVAGAALYVSTLYNCTVVQNSGAPNPIGGGGEYDCTNYDTIVVSNLAMSPAKQTNVNYIGSVFTSSCAWPLPSGVGNISNAPLFIDPLNGNYRLQSSSPCINAGNNAYAAGTTDLDGNPRISGGTVDMGAYEFQNPASIISYAWLQLYGLPTDGSADFADTDHNGMNNWQKWVAGLNPTNPASVLQVMNPASSGTNIVVTWQSVTNISYFLQRSPDLSPGSFQPLATNIPGQSGTTSYTDTNAPAPGPWFYRVGVP